MDLHLFISDGHVKTKIYCKRDDFDLDIVNFPFLGGDVIVFEFARVPLSLLVYRVGCGIWLY